MKQHIRPFGRILCLMLAVIIAVTGLGIRPADAAVTGSMVPDKVNYGTLKWSLNLGTGYTNAPTPPMVQGDYVFVGMGQTLYKLDRATGETLKTMTLVDSFGFATAALTYAETPDGKHVIFAPVRGGVVQAVDADDMTSLWVTKPEWTGEKPLGLSCMSRVVYTDGHIYYGTWNTDTTAGYYYCFDTTDIDTGSATESKSPVWMVKHAGGFYWSEANVDGDYVLFGGEDGNSDYNTPTDGGAIYACMKGGAFAAAGHVLGDDPVVGRETVNGDVRSGVAYDAQSNAFYFTSRAGVLYKRTLNGDGTFATPASSPDRLALGGVTTGTPTVHDGKIYVGVQGPTPFGATGHLVKIVDGQTMTVDDSAPTPGFVQSEMVLSTAKAESGALYLYMTYNQLPGGIYMMKITEPTAGKKAVSDTESGNLFTPPATMQHYGISTLEADGEGNLYYKNDSCTLMAVKAGYLLESVAAAGGAITPSTSVLAGSPYTFTLTPSAGYKLADIKVDGASQGNLKSSYSFPAVDDAHKIEGVFIHTTTPNLSAAVSTGYSSIKLSWSKPAGVTGYEIWRSAAATGTYIKLTTLPASTTTYTNVGLTTGSAYYYKIRGYYRSTTGSIVYSNLSTTAKAAIPRLSTPVLATTAGTDKIKLTWKTVPGAYGYKIYKKTYATGTYYLVKTVTGGTATTWTNYGLTTGKTYYYKMVAYRVVGGKTYYSSYSNESYRKPY